MPAEAGTHDNWLRRSPRPVRLNALELVVGPGLRRDDGVNRLSPKAMTIGTITLSGILIRTCQTDASV